MSFIRIGEVLHCHIPSVQLSARRWLTGDAIDREAGERHLIHLVEEQAAVQADYMDVNVDNFLTEAGIGREGAIEVMGHILDLIMAHGNGIAPCIDSSDPEILEWGLVQYCEELKGKRPPLANSVTITRLDPLKLRERFSFSIVGMLLEKAGDATGFTDIAGPEVYHETAQQIFEKTRAAGFESGQVFFDPTVGPLGADMVGYTKRTFEGIKMIREDADMEGVHICLGLSNCSDGLPRRLAVNRAYLRVAMDYGVDAAICDAKAISGKDLVDGKILKLIREIATGEAMDTLTKLVDYTQAHPRGATPAKRQPIPDVFGQALAEKGGEPIFTLEMAPSEQSVDKIMALAEEAKDSQFHFTITDTPSGNRTPGPDTLALEIAQIMGRQPVVNLSCKSDDRNGLMQRVLGLYHQGVQNFFTVTGDYPDGGRPCFDLDAVTLLWMVDCMRRGLEFPSLLPRARGGLEGLRAGAAVSPFKYLEADTWGQYLKMWKKWRAGASYFITQLGYDVKKFQELKLYMNRAGMADVPVLGTVFYLTPSILKVLNRVHVAGVVIPDDVRQKYYGRLLPKKEKSRQRKMGFTELAETQREFSLRQAALLVDILVRGFDYRGIDLAGVEELETANEIVERYRQLGSQDWRESLAEFQQTDGTRPLQGGPEDAFYLFPEGDDGLLVDGPFQQGDRSAYKGESKSMARLHRMYFEEGKGLNGLLKWGVTGKEDGLRLKLALLAEQVTKSASLGCEMCGDCRIPDLHYMCPEPTQGCAKRLINGPCAGAYVDGMCEVDNTRRCYWGRVIEAGLKGDGLESLVPLQPPKDPALVHTSSWRNDSLHLTADKLDLGEPGPALP